MRFDDWCRLEGTKAELWQTGRLLRTGYVETATHDSAIAWIEADGVENRMMVEKAQGHELRIIKDQSGSVDLIAAHQDRADSNECSNT